MFDGFVSLLVSICCFFNGLDLICEFNNVQPDLVPFHPTSRSCMSSRPSENNQILFDNSFAQHLRFTSSMWRLSTVLVRSSPWTFRLLIHVLCYWFQAFVPFGDAAITQMQSKNSRSVRCGTYGRCAKHFESTDSPWNQTFCHGSHVLSNQVTKKHFVQYWDCLSIYPSIYPILSYLSICVCLAMVLLYAFSRMTGWHLVEITCQLGSPSCAPLSLMDGNSLYLWTWPYMWGDFPMFRKKSSRYTPWYIYIYIIPCNVVWIPHYRFQWSTNHQISLSYCWLYSTPPQTKVLFWGVLYIPWIPGSIGDINIRKKNTYHSVISNETIQDMAMAT